MTGRAVIGWLLLSGVALAQPSPTPSPPAPVRPTAADVKALVDLAHAGESLLLEIDALKSAPITKGTVKKFEALFTAYQRVQVQRGKDWDQSGGTASADLDKALHDTYDLEDQWSDCEIAPIYFLYRTKQPQQPPPRGGPPLAGGVPMWELFRGSDGPAALRIEEGRLRAKAVEARFYPAIRQVDSLYRELKLKRPEP